ncbi:hypothetical protein KFL_001300120 [Klebsormidium nitens]|uniref:NAC domain-containing protein n=1 Tax=Klebsormidium nitens TaxID=105231 RepID=A0A1Y1I0I6_KLENI|nr:hypothetical protein KFL_001300120 [Klebsormidium nitens]|eukprot:GAQ82949.1 hypothetical protein KFL_001300120 [Klebsormidium nitens]
MREGAQKEGKCKRSRQVCASTAVAPLKDQCPRRLLYLRRSLAVLMEGLVCKLEGCSRPVYRDEATNEIYLFCGRTHSRKYEELVAQAAGRPMCKLPGCDRYVYYDEIAEIKHNFCGRTHARAAGSLQRPLRIDPSARARELAGEKLCKLPGCSIEVCVEGNRVHDFCCKTHATKVAECLGPQMKPGFQLKDKEAIGLIQKKHDERQAHQLPHYIFESDIYSCDPWELSEVKRALENDPKTEDWLYWEVVPDGQMKRETGTFHRWKAATGKVTRIKDGSDREIGFKNGLELVFKIKDKHKLVLSPGPTGATQFRWRMVEYRAEAERLQKWRLVVISRAEVAALGQSAGEEVGGTGPAQTDDDVTLIAEDEITMEGQLEAGGGSYQAAAPDMTQALSRTEEVVAFYDERGSKRQRSTEGA